MVLSPSWTNPTRVLVRVGAGTSLTNAQINELIVENEGWFRTWFKETITYNEDNLTHQFVRKAIELYTALDVIASTPMSYRTLNDASLALAALQEELRKVEGVLGAQGIADNIKRT